MENIGYDTPIIKYGQPDTGNRQRAVKHQRRRRKLSTKWLVGLSFASLFLQAKSNIVDSNSIEKEYCKFSYKM